MTQAVTVIENPRGTPPSQQAWAAYCEYVNSGFQNLGQDKMLQVEIHMRWLAWNSLDTSAGPAFDAR